MTLTKGHARNAAKTPRDQRVADMALIVCNADGSPRTGVLGSTQTRVTTTGGMSVNVAAAEFVTSKSKSDGVMIFTNDGTVSVPIPAAPVSNSRIDVICVRHNDDTTGDATALPEFVVRSGTAAASPTKPVLVTGDLELATLRIYAGTTATNGGSNVLTNTYQLTNARGGVVVFRSKSDADDWTNPQTGQQIYCADTDGLYQWEGQWVPIHIPRKTFTPTWSNFTPGPSSVTAWYEIDGGIVSGEIHVTLTTGFAMNSNNIDFAPPVAGTLVENSPAGQAVFVDSGSGWFFGELLVGGGKLQLIARAATAASIARVNFNTPLPWSNSDQIHIAFKYAL